MQDAITALNAVSNLRANAKYLEERLEELKSIKLGELVGINPLNNPPFASIGLFSGVDYDVDWKEARLGISLRYTARIEPFETKYKLVNGGPLLVVNSQVYPLSQDRFTVHNSEELDDFLAFYGLAKEDYHNLYPRPLDELFQEMTEHEKLFSGKTK